MRVGRSQQDESEAGNGLGASFITRSTPTALLSRRRLAEQSESGQSLRFALVIIFNLITVLHIGWGDPAFHSRFAHWLQFSFLGAYVASLVWTERRELFGPATKGLLRAALQPRRLIVLGAVVLCWWWPALAVAGALLLMLHLWGAYVWLLQRNLNPSVVLVGSFVVLIVFGTVALKLPSSTPIEQPISWVDAAFTATSATCVTGLVVRDTGAGFTRFGEWVILGLIQLGGLGVILFGSLVALLMGSSLSLRAAHVIADTTRPGGANPASIRRLVVFAAIVVFGLEAIGAAALYVGWPGSAEWAGAPTGIDQTGDRIFASVFHSISAFCNAGFATTSDGLRSVRFHWTSHVVIAGLIVVGGIGLPVYANFASIIRWRLLSRRQRKSAPPRLSLHSKIVILATISLYLVGVVGLSAGAVLDRGGNLWQALLDGHFMSITARTAGFDTVAPVSIDPLGRLTLMVMMFIGGSPSSAAGGVKTVALVVLLLVAFRAAQGRDSTTIFKRQIPEEIIRKAAALFVLHLAVIGATLATLLVTESGEGGVGALPGGFERLLFESVSACSTVGLSMDATMGITDAGKWALICGMFIGRVGSLAFLVALVGLALKRRPRYDYATEAVTMS